MPNFVKDVEHIVSVPALARLQHLMEQRGRYANLVGPEDWRLKLISRALYSSYRDLSDLGLAEEARKILERGRAPHRN